MKSAAALADALLAEALAVIEGKRRDSTFMAFIAAEVAARQGRDAPSNLSATLSELNAKLDHLITKDKPGSSPQTPRKTA